MMRSAAFMLAGAIVCTALADYLFYDHTLGWTAGAYTLVLTGLVVWRYRAAWRRKAFGLCCVMCVACGLAMIEHPGALEFTMAALGLIGCVLIARHDWTDGLWQWAMRIIRFVVLAVIGPIYDWLAAREYLRRHGSTRKFHLIRASRWTVPLVASLVFVGLFILANPVLEHWADAMVDRLGHWLNRFDLSAARWLFWLTCLLTIWSLMRGRRWRDVSPPHTPAHPPAGVTFARNAARPPTNDAPLVLRCLILFNVVFAVQTLMDAWFLWRGGELPYGLTYAEYAHRGAYPLIATALLAGAIVGVSFRDGGPAHQSRWAKRLVYLWLAQNVMLVISSIWRLWQYVDVYAPTRWRIAAAVWMGMVAIGLLWMILRIIRRRPNAWLVRMNIISAAAVCTVCLFINFDRFIADFNVVHCRERGIGQVELDLGYLYDLGPQSIPALRAYSQSADNIYSAQKAGRFADDLTRQVQRESGDWRGWTWRRHRLNADLRAQAAVLIGSTDF